MQHNSKQSNLISRETILRQIIQQVHSSLDIEEVFQRVADCLGFYLNADHCFIARYDDKTHTLSAPTKEYRSSNDVASMLTADPGLWHSLSSFAKGVCHYNTPVEFDDPKLGVSDEVKAHLGRVQVQSGIGCMIWFQDQCLAVLFIHQVKSARNWSSDEKGIIQISAQQSGVAIHHAEVYQEAQWARQETEERQRRQELTLALFKQAFLGTELQMLFNQTLQLVCDTLKVKYARIIERVPNSEKPLLIRDVQGFDKSLIAQKLPNEMEPQANYTLESEAPLIVGNIYEEQRFGPSPLHLEYGLVSGISVIIYGTKELFGVLEADSTEKIAFKKIDIIFMQSLAHILGMAVEKHQSEVRFYQQLAFTQSITASVADGIYALNTEGKLTFLNPAAERLLGWEQKELLGQPFHQLVHFQKADGSPLPEQECPLLAVLRTGKTLQSYEDSYTRKDGKQFPALCSSAPIAIQGKTQGMVVAFRDITERKQVEQALIRSEAKFRHIFESNMLGIMYCKIENRIFDANDAFLKMIGYTREELEAGRLGWRDITPPEYLALDEFANEELSQHKVFTPFEKQYICKDGHLIDVLLGGTFEEGSNENCILYVLDITERKKAERKLAESENRFRTMAETSSVMIWLFTPQLKVAYLNPAVLNYFGVSYDEIAQAGWEAYTHPEDLPQALDRFLDSYQTKQDYKNEFRLLYRDGTYRWVLASGGPIFDATGKNSTGFIGTIIDIHDRKQAEEALKEYARQLEQSNKDLDQFAAMASHDLKAPLRKIKLFSENLYKTAQNQLDEESLADLARIQQSIETMQSLTDALLALAKVARSEQNIQNVDLALITQKIVDDFHEQIRVKSATVEVQSLMSIKGDPIQLQQLMQNLIENSLKFSKADVAPVIKISAECNNKKHCQIFVEDNGIGFPQEQAERVLEPFERLHGKGTYPGSGIGLAICKRIVERHGGTLKAESQPNQGTRFIITLPYQRTFKIETKPAPVFTISDYYEPKR